MKIWIWTGLVVAMAWTGAVQGKETVRFDVSTGAVADSLMFEGDISFSRTTGPSFTLASVTSTERDAMSPSAGAVIYNETWTRAELYTGSGWVTVGTSNVSSMTLATATQMTVTGGQMTPTVLWVQTQPESGTSDDLDTLNMSAGQSLMLYMAEPGTDTLTVKHGTGNLSCLGASDLTLSEGALWIVSDGTTAFVIGGGGLATDVNIGGLSAVGAIQGTDRLMVERGGVRYYGTVANLPSSGGGGSGAAAVSDNFAVNVSLGSNGQTLGASGLALSATTVWEVRGSILLASASAVSWRFNGDSTSGNYDGSSIAQSGTTLGDSDDTANLLGSYLSTSGAYTLVGTITISADGYATLDYTWHSMSTGSRLIHEGQIRRTSATVSEITAVTIYSAHATGLAAGSWLQVYQGRDVSGGGGVAGPETSTARALAAWSDDTSGGELIDTDWVIAPDSGSLTVPISGTYGMMTWTPQSSAPSAPYINQMYVDDGSNTASGEPAIRQWDGSAWDDLGADGGVVSGSAVGDLLYYSGSAWTALAPGADGQALRVVDNVPTWSSGGSFGYWTLDRYNDSLVAYYPLDETSGVRNDTITRTGLGDANTVGWTNGMMGNAALFTAANQEYLVGGGMAAPVKSLCVHFWLLPLGVSTSMGYVAFTDDVTIPTTEPVYNVGISGGTGKLQTLGYTSGGSVSLVADAATADRVWYSIGVYLDLDDKLYLYINGVSQGTPATPSGTFDRIRRIVLGGDFAFTSASAVSADCAIDEVGHWQEIDLRDATERGNFFDALYASGNGRFRR